MRIDYVLYEQYLNSLVLGLLVKHNIKVFVIIKTKLQPMQSWLYKQRTEIGCGQSNLKIKIKRKERRKYRAKSWKPKLKADFFFLMKTESQKSERIEKPNANLCYSGLITEIKKLKFYHSAFSTRS